jgi:CRP-like cAMP-binding protein
MMKQHISKFVELTDDEYDEISQYFELIDVKKKQVLHEVNTICRHNYFVVKGCLRMFFVAENGAEQTTQFAIENWWLTDLFSFQRQANSEFCIQAVEPSKVLRISKPEADTLLENHPVMEKYFRHVYQSAAAAAQLRVKFFRQYTREQLYIHFSEAFPEFNQRVPQYLVASYLGFTPEYLSEIRNRLAS